ncbi:MAG: hypothetical protein ACYCSQ_01930 [bacterium]
MGKNRYRVATKMATYFSGIFEEKRYVILTSTATSVGGTILINVSLENTDYKPVSMARIIITSYR